MAKRQKVALGLSAAVMLSGAVAAVHGATPFKPGDLVVTRAVGGTVDSANATNGVAPINGPTQLTNGGVAATLVLDEYTPTGTLVQEITLPNVQQTNTAPGSQYALTLSGTQNQEGTIELSGDGRYFSVAGYNQTAGLLTNTTLGGTASNGTNGVAATTVQRVVGLIGIDGSVDTSTGLTNVANAVSVRAAYTSDGTNIWVSGAAKNATQDGGLQYTTKGSTTATQVTAIDTTGGTNIVGAYNFGAGLQLLGGSLKATSQTPADPANGTLQSVFFRGIAAEGTGLPTSGTAANTTLPAQFAGFDANTTLTNGQTTDNFWFKDANTLYIADNRIGATANVTNSAQYGGVQKWVNVGGVWTFQYNVTLGNSLGVGQSANPVGAHGLSGQVDAQGNVFLYATTFDNGAVPSGYLPAGSNPTELFSIEDPASPNATPSFDTPVILATSAFTQDSNGNMTFTSAFRGVAVVPLLGDTNGDGTVDLNDLNAVLNHLGTTSYARADGNFDNAATIDLNDLNDVLNNLGQKSALYTGASAALTPAATPEPASVGLLGVGVVGMLLRKRRRA